MKKTNNKGFSLVELIIVIAIMAILAGAIAPALIKYIDKSRKSNDVSSAKTIKTAIETALGTESVYETLTNTTGVTKVVVLPGKTTAAEGAANGAGTTAVKLYNCTKPDEAATFEECAKAIGTNIGEKSPKVKYKKQINTEGEKGSDITPGAFVAYITPGGTVYVCIADGDGTNNTVKCEVDGSGIPTFSKCAPLAPEVCKGYQ